MEVLEDADAAAVGQLPVDGQLVDLDVVLSCLHVVEHDSHAAAAVGEDGQVVAGAGVLAARVAVVLDAVQGLGRVRVEDIHTATDRHR